MNKEFFVIFIFPKLSLYPLECPLHHQSTPLPRHWTWETYKPDHSHTLHVLALPNLHVTSNSNNRWQWRPHFYRDITEQLCCRRDSIPRQHQIDMRTHCHCLIDNEDCIATATTTMLIRSEKSTLSNRSTVVMEERPRARIYESKWTMWHFEHVRVSANNATPPTPRANKLPPLWKPLGILEFLHLWKKLKFPIYS